jgi:hypothetical protein
MKANKPNTNGLNKGSLRGAKAYTALNQHGSRHRMVYRVKRRSHPKQIQDYFAIARNDNTSELNGLVSVFSIHSVSFE